MVSQFDDTYLFYDNTYILALLTDSTFDLNVNFRSYGATYNFTEKVEIVWLKEQARMTYFGQID